MRIDDPIPTANQGDLMKGLRRVLVLRRFWIRSGTFEEFARISSHEIWPGFEHMGARVEGLYLAETPDPHPNITEPCDMAILLTAYASKAHWKATRSPVKCWGEHPVLDKMLEGIAKRRKLTLQTSSQFLMPADVVRGGPYFNSLKTDFTDEEFSLG